MEPGEFSMVLGNLDDIVLVILRGVSEFYRNVLPESSESLMRPGPGRMRCYTYMYVLLLFSLADAIIT